MSAIRNSASARRPYVKPSCKLVPISAVCQHLRENSLREAAVALSGSSVPPVAGPDLLITGYSGHASLIEESVRTIGTLCRRVSLEDRIPALHITLTDVREDHAGLLLIDLREAIQVSKSLFEKIGRDFPDQRNALAVLVHSITDLPPWDGFYASNCWRIQATADSDLLARTLQSFLGIRALASQGRSSIEQYAASRNGRK